jgi:hypothetical protein
MNETGWMRGVCCVLLISGLWAGSAQADDAILNSNSLCRCHFTWKTPAARENGIATTVPYPLSEGGHGCACAKAGMVTDTPAPEEMAFFSDDDFDVHPTACLAPGARLYGKEKR